jgi:hypothetical protein
MTPSLYGCRTACPVGDIDQSATLKKTGEEMRNWMKNGARIALVAAGFAAVGAGIANADTVGGDSHLAVGPDTTMGAALNGSSAGRSGWNSMSGDGGGVGTAASSGLSLGKKGLQSSGTLCGSSALSTNVANAACGNAAVTNHHLGTGLASSGTLTSGLGNASTAGSSLAR